MEATESFGRLLNYSAGYRIRAFIVTFLGALESDQMLKVKSRPFVISAQKYQLNRILESII